jgi:hypothetical protein
MNPDTGRLAATISTDFPIGVFGPIDGIAAVSGAVRAHDQGISLEEARAQAMAELRQLNKTERNRGRR